MNFYHWLISLKDAFFSLGGRNSRKRRKRTRPLNEQRMELLEARNMLATIGFDAGSGLLTFEADAGVADIVSVSSPSQDVLQIQVGNGESITLAGDAVGNPDFQLSQFVVADDTLQIDISSSIVDSFQANLGDLDDTFTATALPGVSSLIVNGETGSDVIDISAIGLGATLIGGGGNDVLTGGSGNDVLVGGGGTDVIDGGLGIDTNSFQGIGLGVTATVDADGAGTAVYGMVNETFVGIENLTGSENDDILTATGAAANVLRGEGGNDILAGGGGTDVIDGGLGIDTNSFQGIGFGVTATVDADGEGTAVYGMVNETFVGIENLTGSENDDILTATGAADNVLSGEGGNDVLTGGEGNDILVGGGGTDVIDGGLGIDTNSFQGIGLGVTATVDADGAGTAVYGPVNETFVGIENLTGSENDDILTATGAAANVLRGEGGNDILAGGGGTDVIDGGLGIDTNSFQGIGFGVTATVDADGTGTAVYGPVNETFVGIENLTGSENDDILTATGAAANVLRGEGGNDILAGGGGTDVIDGGLGIDTNSFDGIAFGVTAIVDADGTGTAVYGTVNESFVGIENLTGSRNDDVLTATGIADNVLIGGVGNDILTGGAGNDTLIGNSGEDTLRGATGDDVLIGGSGNDTLNGGSNDDILRGNNGDDLLIGSGGTDIITGGNGIDTNSFRGIGFGVFATVNDDGTGTAAYGLVSETFRTIENLTGSENNDTLVATGISTAILRGRGGDDVLTGSNGSNLLVGGDGNDTIIGGDGDDTILGGSGDDLLIGNAGLDLIIGGVGDDMLFGGEDDDELLGNEGDDILFGGLGIDELFGGSGDNQLFD